MVKMRKELSVECFNDLSIYIKNEAATTLKAVLLNEKDHKGHNNSGDRRTNFVGRKYLLEK